MNDCTRPVYFLKSAIVLLFFLMGGLKVNAQNITKYIFTGTTGTFTPISGATTPVLSDNIDDGKFQNLPIGFDFFYMGSRYTAISASTNGWLAMGATLTDDYVNSLTNSGVRPVLAPLWDDLSIVAASNVTYRTTGTAGSRVFTIQYLNLKWNYQATNSSVSFQVNLYESTGVIQYIYRSETGATNSATASIGITATAKGSGNFLSVNSNGSLVSSTTETAITTKRATGTTYRFTPPVPTAPTNLTFTSTSGTAMTLNWTDNSANETGFVIYRSTDNINFTFVNQTSANAVTSVQTGLSAGTVYYWKVYAVTEGGLSTELTGNQLATCSGPVIAQLPLTNLMGYYKFEGNASDNRGINNGILQGAPALATDRFNIAAKAYTFNGSSQYISTVESYANPASYSTSIWFKTTTTVGGALIGFSSLQTGAGGSRDRMMYMTATGNIYAAVAPGAVKKTVNSATAYNDGNWHMATNTVGAGGLKLYIDGALVVSDATVTTSEVNTGYWRIGYSDVSTWPNEPASGYFQGTLDDAIIYHRELTAAEVMVLYNSPDGAGSNMPVCAGSTLNLSATTVAGATYQWTGPNGFTSALQNPSLTYAAVNEGIYTLQVTVAGCSTPTVAYAKVTSTGTAGQWTGNVSSDWATASNWCSGLVPTSTTNVTITAGATRMPLITTSVSCNNLVISSGATVTTSGTGILNIAGLLTNSGTFTSTGTTNFNGTTEQTYSGISAFYNLTVSNTAGLVLPAIVTVNNNLTLAAGTLTTNNFNLTVNGNWINNSAATAFVSGTSQVAFTGTVAQTIGGTYATAFNVLRITNTGPSVTLLNNINIAADLAVTAGIFDLGAFTANRVTSGGTILLSAASTLKVGGTNTFPTNYTTNNLIVSSTVEYNGTNQTVASQPYGNLTLSSGTGSSVKIMPATALTILGNFTTNLGTGTALTVTEAAALRVNGNVNIGAATTINGASYGLSVGGSWNNVGVFNGNTGTVTFFGPGTSISGAGTQNFNNLTFIASGITLANNALTLTGNLATTGSGAFIQASGGTLTMTGSGTTISGNSIVIDNLMISSTGSVSSSASLTVKGNLGVSNSGSFTSSTNVFMTGTDKTILGPGAITFNTLQVAGALTTTANFSITMALNVSGSFAASAGTATFTGTSTLSGTANLYNTTINGTSLQLTSNSVLGVANVLTLLSGTLNVTAFTPNTVDFNGAGAQTINGITYNNLSLSTAATKTAAAAITVNNDITIGTGVTFAASSFTHTLEGNWTNNGTFNASTGTIIFSGAKTVNIKGATTFNTLTINKTANTIPVTLLSNVSATLVNITSGLIQTGNNALTVTSDRTGNGIILGTIIRTHAFSAGINYSFESPANTLSFVQPAGINSVTVKVAIGSIADFPFGGSVSREYNVTIPNGTYSEAVLRLHYEDDELNGSNESTMNLWKNTGSGWAASGKTTANGTANYVEQSGLTNVSGRWTLSDNSNVVNWNGSVSSDWNNASNWTVQQGSASRPPVATDIVNLGNISFTNQPTINTNVSVKNINFGSVQPVTLTMATGGSLTSGDIHGTWSANATHNVNVNNQNVTINGDLVLSDGTTGHVINLNVGTGTVAIKGSLTQSGNANIVFSGAGTLSINDQFNYTNGTFTPGTGTVIYSGTISQTVGAVTYNNLIINKTSSAVINSALAIAGDLTITSGELDNLAAISIIGNVSIGTSTIFRNNGSIKINGNWINNGTYSAVGAGISFEGGNAQSISATTFNNLTINKVPGTTATLTGNIGIGGDLVLTSGTLDIQTFTADRTASGGSTTVAAAATLVLAANNLPANFTSYNIAPTSTTILNGTAAQAIAQPGIVFGNLMIRNTGIKTLGSGVVILSNLTIENAATLEGTAQIINLGGSWINNGTFTPGTSTVLLTGTGNIAGNTTFNRVTISGTYAQTGSLVTYNDLLTITSTGTITGAAGITTVLISDLINRGTLITNGTTTFTGTKLQTLSLINATTVALTVNFNGTVSPALNSTSAPQFSTLNINNTGGVAPSVGWTIFSALNTGPGATFAAGGYTHNILGSLTNNGTITSSGTINFTPTTAVALNMGTTFTSTGTVAFGGSGAITLLGTPVSLANVVISNTNSSGLTPSSNWQMSNNFTIAGGATFKGSTFTNTVGGNILNSGTMDPASSTFILNLTNNQTISNGVFNNLTLNKASGSVTLLSNATATGVLTFTAGKITTGSYNFGITATGTVSGAAQQTGWINGNLKKNIGTGATTKSFEVGDVNNYTPVNLVFNSVSTAGDLQITTIAADHPNISSSTINQASSVNRYWPVINSGVVFDKYNATLNFIAADVDGGASTAAFGVGVFDGSSWSTPVTTIKNPTSTTATNINVLGDFAVGEVCNAGTTILYTASPYCTNLGTAAVTLTGTTGGVFSSTPGLSIDPSTGTISLASSAAGTYTVNYTVAATSTCKVYSTSTTVVITKAASATISYPGSPYYSNGGIASVNLSGSPGGIFSAPAGLTLDANTGDVTLLSSSPGTYTVTYTIEAAGGCSAFTITSSITVISFKTWDGGAGTPNWSDPVNWLPDGVPVITDHITLSGAFTINADIAAVSADLTMNNSGLLLTINAGKSLSVAGNLTVTAGTLDVNTGTLKLAAGLSSTGTISAANGSVELNGSAVQTIPEAFFTGNTVNNLKIDNSAGAVLGGVLNVRSILMAASGNLNSSGFLTLVSTAAQTALIDGSGMGNITGNVTMERYLSAGFGYKYFSSPVASATVNSFSNVVNLGASFPNFYTYIENVAISGWTSYTGAANALVPLQGYAADFGSDTQPKKVSITGVVNNGLVSATLLNHNQPYTKGFNLVGNPYPSPVNWNIGEGWTKNNIDNAIYFFDSSNTSQYTGTYCSYINGISSDGLASNIIASMQGFFVHVSNGTFPVTGTLAVNNTARVNDLSPVFHKAIMSIKEPKKPRTLIRLSAGFADEPHAADPIVIYVADGAGRTFNPLLDAIKLLNTNERVPNFYGSNKGTEKLAISAIEEIDTTTVVPLSLQADRNGTVDFVLRDLENLPAPLYLYFYDAKTKRSTLLEEDTKVSMQLNTGVYDNRFSLRFSNTRTETAPGAANDIFRVYSKGGSFHVNLKLENEQRGELILTNMAGQELARKTISGNGVYEINSAPATGIYIVSFVAPDSVRSKKVIHHNE
ncbi:hypothetical protein GJU39_00105 [Pedobacter petrophilus]|uniref:Fibronectin type-III domain-containing protein n=1 Tax=Pedobacter petrophilus TaxID=1908241 RepID=A0A7K0FS86_9SPHI|nr:fibronectin type III domain-containing protein [Pedobacter petrophilus]MRX74473.1 hypothetical protein [Pedobacter petrophilus]